MTDEAKTKDETKQAGFVSDVLKLVSGATFVQAFGVLIAPILAQLFAPEAFGIAALFASIILVIQVILTLGYDRAIMLPEADEEAANLLGVSLWAVVIISLLTIPIVWFGQTQIANWLGAPTLAAYLWLLPLTLFLNGLYQALRAWNSRSRRFGRLSLADASASLSTSGAKLAAGFAGYTTGGSLIGGNILGTFVSSTILGRQIWRDDYALLRESINRPNMLSGLKRYRKFPFLNTGSTLLNTLSWQLPIFMLSMFFSPTVVGFYSLGNRVVRLPMIFVGRAVGQVFYQRAAVAFHSGELVSVVLPVYRRLVIYSLFPMLFLTLTGKELFIAIFGATWTEAGIYTQILSVYMFFVFISSPLAALFNVLEKQEVAVIVNIILLLSRYIALLLGGMTDNILYTLILFSLSGILVYGGYSMYILHAAGVSQKTWWTILMQSTLISGIFLAPAWILVTIFQLQSWLMLLPYSICAMAYYLWVLSKDRQMINLIQRLYSRLRRLRNR